jgi:hypothetical protein
MNHIDKSEISWRNTFEDIKETTKNRRKLTRGLEQESIVFASALVQLSRRGATIEKSPKEVKRIIHRASRNKLD